jgi:hypothetical protein
MAKKIEIIVDVNSESVEITSEGDICDGDL